MAQEILLKSGERVNRYDYMEQMARHKKMKEDAKKKQPVKEAAPEKIENESKPLEKMTVKELQAVAAEKNLEVAGMKKADLLELLMDSESEDDTGL